MNMNDRLTRAVLAGVLEVGHVDRIEDAAAHVSTWAETAHGHGYDLAHLVAFAVESESGAGYDVKLLTRHCLRRLTRNPELNEFLSTPTGPDELLAALPGPAGECEGVLITRKGAL